MGFLLVLLNHDVFNDYTPYMEYDCCLGDFSSYILFAVYSVFLSFIYLCNIYIYISIHWAWLIFCLKLDLQIETSEAFQRCWWEFLKFALLLLIWKLIIYWLLSKMMSYFPSILYWWPMIFFFFSFWVSLTYELRRIGTALFHCS